MWEEEFGYRLAKLREIKGVSARDMSLSIGQNPGYINRIENRKALPSMSAFLFMCDYLGVTPSEFFDVGNSDPEKIRTITRYLKTMDSGKLDCILTLTQYLADHEN